MSEDAAFLRDQARRCRRLARGVDAPDLIETLDRLAADYDGRAAKIEEEERRET